MINDSVWGAMQRSFERSNKFELPERLITSLEAGQIAGGDVGVKQSAAIVVVSPKVSPNFWSGRLVDLRVEDHPNPIPELKRLLRLQRGYEFANKGDELLAKGSFGESLRAYERASRLAPEIEELKFWQAVSLVQANRVKEAKPLFKQVFKKKREWIQVTKSLPEVGLLPDDPSLLKQIIN